MHPALARTALDSSTRVLVRAAYTFAEIPVDVFVAFKRHLSSCFPPCAVVIYRLTFVSGL